MSNLMLPGFQFPKSCFLTQVYMGHHIHSNYNNVTGKEEVSVQLYGCHKLYSLYKDIPSYVAAERLIRGVVCGRSRRKRVTPVVGVA